MSEEEIVKELKQHLKDDYNEALDRLWSLDMDMQEYGEMRGIFPLVKEKEYVAGR